MKHSKLKCVQVADRISGVGIYDCWEINSCTVLCIGIASLWYSLVAGSEPQNKEIILCPETLNLLSVSFSFFQKYCLLNFKTVGKERQNCILWKVR